MALTKVKGSVWDSSDNGISVSVKDYGAVGDGSTDDASAVQAAVDAIEAAFSGTIAQQNTFNSATLYFPAGRYIIGSLITISTPGIVIKGDGQGATKIQHSSNTGFFQFRHADYLDGQNINNCGIKDLELIGTASATAVADVGVKAYICRFFRVDNVRFSNLSVSLDLIACEEPVHINNCTFWQDNANLTSTSTLRLLSLEVNNGTTNAYVDPDTGLDYYKNSMVFMDNCEFRSRTGVTSQHVYIDGVDGFYVSNCHILNATNQLVIDPVSSAVSVSNIVWNNVFFDGSASETLRNLYVQNKTYTTKNSAFNLTFQGCKFNGADTENIRLDHADLQDFVIDGGLVDLCPGNYMINARYGVRLLEIKNVRFRFGGGGPDLGAVIFDARNTAAYTDGDFFDYVVFKNNTIYPSGGSGGTPVRIVHVESDGDNSPVLDISDNTYKAYSALTSFIDDDSSPAVSIIESNNKRLDTEQATGTYTIDPGTAITEIDSTGGAVTATLGSARTPGFIKTIVMTNATASSTVSVTNHETSDPEVITFAAVDDTAVLMWTGTEWITLKLSGATV